MKITIVACFLAALLVAGNNRDFHRLAPNLGLARLESKVTAVPDTPRHSDLSRTPGTGETYRWRLWQHLSRPPAVHEVVRSSHVESIPVPSTRLRTRPGVTGADWSGHRFITRNEGVPGSSPGVGSKSPA